MALMRAPSSVSKYLVPLAVAGLGIVAGGVAAVNSVRIDMNHLLNEAATPCEDTELRRFAEIEGKIRDSAETAKVFYSFICDELGNCHSPNNIDAIISSYDDEVQRFCPKTDRGNSLGLDLSGFNDGEISGYAIYPLAFINAEMRGGDCYLAEIDIHERAHLITGVKHINTMQNIRAENAQLDPVDIVGEAVNLACTDLKLGSGGIAAGSTMTDRFIAAKAEAFLIFYK